MAVSPVRFEIPVFCLFVLFWLASVFLVKWEIGLPVRTLILFFGVLYISIIYRSNFTYIFFKNFHFWALLSIGLIGFFMSSFYTLDLVASGLYSLKWIIQPALILVFTMLCCLYIGEKTVVIFYAGVILLSCTVAILQYFDLQLAWDLKSQLDAIQSIDRVATVIAENDSGFGVYNDRFRARGLSYSPIHLGYQIALVWGLFYISWQNNNPTIFPFPRLVRYTIIGVLFFAIIATGTRSIFFGILLLYILHFLFNTKNKSLLIIVALISIAFISIGSTFYAALMNALDIRVLSIENSSSFSRLPLALFGLLLFADNPIGHGWLIEAEVYANEYWQYLHQFQNAEAIVQLGLHNHLIKTLFVYGLGGLATLFFYIKSIFKYYGLVYLIGLSPYYFHSLFHNDGIFLGGNYIWVFMGIIHFDFVKASIANKVSHNFQSKGF